MKRGGNLLNYILDQISDLEGVTFRKSYKGIHFNMDDVTFGRIQGGKFKLQASSSCGSNPDVEVEIQKNGQPLYLCEVPEPVLEDKNRLKEWIQRIISKK